MQEMIRVVNNNDETVRGRYDGKDYVFKKGKPTDITLEAAAHIFGFGEENKTQALNMLGWLTPGRDTIEDAMAKLDNISFLVGRTVFDEEPELESTKEPGDAPTSQVPVGKGRRGAVAPPQNP